jgi:adenylate kinase
LQKKYKNSIKTFVVCPGIIYGEEEDIFHYIFKSCYLNSPQVEIFLPASNKLPVIYIHDFARFVIQIITKKLQDEGANYLLAVQQNPLSVKEIVANFIEIMGGEEMRLRICEKEEIFLMNEDMMTQRVFDHLTLDLNIQSELLTNFEFEINGLNFSDNIPKIIGEFYNARDLRPVKILIDGSPFAYQNDLAKILSDFYHIHHVKNRCFLKNLLVRLRKKLDGAMDYQAKMGDIAWKLDENVDCPMMML